MDTSSAIALLGGLGLFLLGIHHLTEGLKGLAGDSLRRAPQRLVAGWFSAIAFGAVFTALIQSSSATVLTVIGFVSAGLVSFSQAVGVLIGVTFGTAATPWLVAFFGFRVQISAVAMPMLGADVRRRLAGEAVDYEPAVEGVQQIAPRRALTLARERLPDASTRRRTPERRRLQSSSRGSKPPRNSTQGRPRGDIGGCRSTKNADRDGSHGSGYVRLGRWRSPPRFAHGRVAENRL